MATIYWVRTRAFGAVPRRTLEDAARVARAERLRTGTRFPDVWRVTGRSARVEPFADWPKGTRARFVRLSERDAR